MTSLRFYRVSVGTPVTEPLCDWKKGEIDGNGDTPNSLSFTLRFTVVETKL